MPQLDRLAYGSQVVWLVIMFFVLYLILVKTGLPRLYKVLRFRKDKLLFVSDEIVKGGKEVFFVARSSKAVALGVVSTMRGRLDNIGKILENDLEERRLGQRVRQGKVRDVLNFREFDIVSDLVTTSLVDNSKHVKKGLVEKKVIGG